MALSPNFWWATALFASIVLDAFATAYLKIASERLEGSGFFLASMLGVLVYAPSIILIGYAFKVSPSYLATIGIWFIGAYAANALLGIIAFDDTFTFRTAAGIAAAGLTVFLLRE